MIENETDAICDRVMKAFAENHKMAATKQEKTSTNMEVRDYLMSVYGRDNFDKVLEHTENYHEYRKK